MARGSYNHMQQIGDAFKDARMSSRMMNQARELDELGNLLSRLDMITNAMWELLQDNGITREMLYKKMDELVDRRKQGHNYYTRVACPRCGKPIQESTKMPLIGRCVYCGAEVTFYPYSDDVKLMENDDGFEEEPEEAPVVPQDHKPYNPSEDLGF